MLSDPTTDERADREDARTIARRLSDDRERHVACQRLRERNQPALEGFLRNQCVKYRLDRTVADDVAQETWLRVWAKLPEVADEQLEAFRPRSWIFRIARNRFFDELRKRRPGSPIDEGDAVCREPSALEALERKEKLAAFQVCLEELTERARRVIVERTGGATHAEIAESLGFKTVNACSSFYDRAKKSVVECVTRKLR